MQEQELWVALRGAARRSGPVIVRALAHQVVLDTWMNGEVEEDVTFEADGILTAATARWARRAQEAGAVFPGYPMVAAYVEAVFSDLLTGTALYAAQQRSGRPRVTARDAQAAVERLTAWLEGEAEGLTAAGRYHGVIALHEDLNALAYYGRVPQEDFLLGTRHRPWSDRLLTPEFAVYRQAGLVATVADGSGDWVELTDRGRTLLADLRSVLEEAGEFAWRANAQRWVIFGETDYDAVYHRVLPTINADTRAFLDSLPLTAGAQVLEVGAGTGRVTFDLGLADRVAAVGGRLTVVEPSAALLRVLRQKQAAHPRTPVALVQGVAEALPFADDSFDLVIGVAMLHFTEVEQALRELARVTRPGGWVATANSDGRNDVLAIPMVASWFRPLIDLAAKLGVPPGERQGVPRERVEAAYAAAGLVDLTTTVRAGWMSAEDPDAFLAFVLRGGAFFQNVLARIPYRERWALLQRLAREGPAWRARTQPEEQRAAGAGYIVLGRKPAGRTSLRRSVG
ncbi:MAG: class I SAM-dependent methyltransferase [Firmicutes bacterium]|nr:class I SAM-dependent methyltransferase [Bacillota bacterium]